MWVQEMEMLEKYVEAWFKRMEHDTSGASTDWWVINTHLLIHLVRQLKVMGPMRETWMYAFESMNGRLKRWVKNNAYPVQSIMGGTR